MLKEVREARLKEYKEKFIPKNESVLRNLMGFCLDERGKNIHMIMDDSLSSRTDGKTIWVSLLEPFLDPKYNSAFWTLIMKALLAHECQHINSTLLKEGFAMADKFAEWFEKNHGIDNRIGKNIAADMFNIIEDARIENIIVHNHPGWTMMFKIMNGEIRASGKILEIAEDPRTEFNHFRTQILSYAVCGGNAIGIDLYSGHRMEKEFDKIRGMIDKAVESYSCQECIDETFTVLCTIAPYLAELMKDDNALMQQLESMMNSISGGNDEIDFNGQSSSGGNGLRIMANRKPNPNNSQDHQNSQNSQSSQDSQDDENDGSNGSGQNGEQNGEDDGATGSQGNQNNSDTKSGSDSGSESQNDSKENSKADSKEGSQSGSGDDSEDDSEESSQGETGSKDEKNSKDDNSKDDSKNNSGNSSKDGSQDNPKDDSDGKCKGDSKKDSSNKPQDNSEDGHDGNSQGNSNNDSKSRKNKSNNQDRGDDKKVKDYETPAETDMTGTFSDKELQQRGYTEEEMRQAVEMVRQEMEDWGTESVKRQSKSRAFRGNVTRIKEDKGTKFSEVKIVCGKSPLPADLKKRGEKLKREISYILKTKFHDRRGLKNGRLDERCLWRVPCKQENVFIKKNSRKKNSVVIYLLIDNSGSMDEKSKHLYAMQVAAILEEAIGETVPMKIVLFNSGFTKVTHYLVKDYEDHGKFNYAYNSLNAIVPDNGNRDGYSIRVATNDLSKRKEKNKILLVLSDGLPSVYSSREEGIQDVKTAVKNARAMGIEVIAMPFGSKDFIKKAMNDFVEMYETNIIAAGIDNIGKIMCDLFKKLITK